MVRGRAARIPRRPAAAEGRDRRGRDRRGARRRRDARERLRPGRVPGRGRRAARSGSRARWSPAPRTGSRAPPLRPTAPAPRYRPPTSCSAWCRADAARAGRHARDHRPHRRRLRLAGVQGRSTGRRRSAGRPRSTAIASASSATTGRSTRPARNKATHFIQRAASSATPIVYLQNTTGYMVGKDGEQGGMIKHGSQDDPGGDQRDGAADHHPVRRLVRRRQLRHVRPRLRPALPLRWPTRADRGDGRRAGGRARCRSSAEGAGAQGRAAPTQAQIAALKATDRRRRSSARPMRSTPRGLLLDDGVIDPRDTRRVLALCLAICARPRARTLRPIQFGVARP